MPDLDPPPAPGRPSASGRAPAPGVGARGDGADPPTVRSGPPSMPGPAPVGSGLASASAGSSGRRGEPGRPAVVPLPLPVPGDRIDVFDLEESIGAGGMGAVFRAVDVKLDRQVALKILPPDQAVDPDVVLRYQQEGRAAARLDHENIARVYTIGDDGRYHYIAFEYIEGTTIRQRVERGGPLDVGDAINYTLQIANALVHAAGRGVVHRDIKPSNIIVTPQGRAKLVDMGLARRFERGQDAGLTQSGMTLGTFDYISPEQARDPRDVDVRGDLYSLGCTLFHMLSGRPPFPEGTVLQKLLQHQEESPPEIRGLNPAVPDDLAAILVKLMAKDRDRRYQTPEQLVRDLLTVAGSLGLRSLNPEGLVWMAPAVAPGWVGHLVWGVPGLAFLLILAGLAWWGDGPIAPTVAIEPATPTPMPLPASPPPTGPATAGKPPGPRSARVPEPEAEPPREYSAMTGDDLLRILAEAPPRSTILLSEKGPYDLRGPKLRRLSRPDVTIRAERGVRPVIRLPREPGPDAASPPAALLDIRGGRVSFEGLEFVVDRGIGGESAGGDGAEAPAAVRVEDAEVSFRRCSFRRPGGAPARSRAAAILARSTAARPGAAAPGEAAATLVIDACHFDGGQAGVIAVGPVDVSCRDSTFGPAPADLATFWCDNPESSAVPAEFRLAHASVMVGPGPAFRFAGTAPRVRVSDSAFAPPAAPPSAPPATLVAIDAPDRLDWRGADNLYGQVAIYLRAGGARPPIRSFDAWADDPALLRESGSTAFDGHAWDERDPLGAAASGAQDPARAFRLALPRTVAARPGARQGPAGLLPTPAAVATAPPAGPAIAGPAPAPPSRPDRGEPARPPMEVAIASGPIGPGPTPAGRERPVDAAEDDEMKEMPLAPSTPGRPADLRGDDPGATTPAADLPTAVDPERTPMPVAPPADPAVDDRPPAVGPSKPAGATPALAAADPAPIRTALQLGEALDRAGPGSKPIVLAADADIVVPAARVRGPATVVIRAERGATRPRVRFRPDPADLRASGGWTAWLTLPSGGLRVEGVDVVLVLPTLDAPRGLERPWAAFAVGAGGHLALADCTVTIEGAGVRSAVVAVLAGDPGGVDDLDPPPPALAALLTARVRIKDCLLRAGDDLVDVAAGRGLELELDNAAVATGGTLVHGHGLAAGTAAGPIKVALRQVAARLGGGLARLESAPGRPELPLADVVAHETILATNDPDTPLFRVDGQGDLDQLRDRVRWEGRAVAYHQIDTYRRDQSARPGALPNRFDRDSWKVAVGLREDAPIHGDLGFLNDWGPGRDPWTLRPEDLRLRPDTPAADAAVGPDLLHIPAPPSAPRP